MFQGGLAAFSGESSLCCQRKPPAMPVVQKSSTYGEKKKTSNDRVKAGSPTADTTRSKEVVQMDSNSLAHTKWNCKYHIVFTPKYRRQAIYQQISADIGQIIRVLCRRKEIEIIQAAALKDHIHLYVAIPPKLSVAYVVGYLKGKSSLMIFDRHANLKYKYGNRHFWCRGYYVDTVGRNEKAINEYVKNQLQEDIAADQMSMKEYTDPFTGEPVNKGK